VNYIHRSNEHFAAIRSTSKNIKNTDIHRSYGKDMQFGIYCTLLGSYIALYPHYRN